MESDAKTRDFPIMLVRTARHMPGYTVTQPLGILYLASALRQHGYENVRLMDMRPGCRDVRWLSEQIRQYRPRFLGLSALSYEAPTVADIVREVREIDQIIHVAIGGPLPSSMKERTFEIIPADSVAIGEGERTIIELVDRLSKGDLLQGKAPPQNIPGLLFRGQKTTGDPILPEYIDDLNDLPLPAWDLLDITRYFGSANFNFFLKYPNYMSVMTTRGCPYQCAYCHNVLGKIYRKRSVESVMREIRVLHEEYGIREFHLIDDSFNLDLDRAKAILDEIAKIRPPVAIAFPNGLRSDRLDEEFLHKAKAAGVYKINFAVETASPRLQRKIKKNLDLEKVRRIIEISDRLGIIGHGFFMLGFPTETEDEMLQTVDFAVRSRLHTANFFVVQPFEGTDIYEMFKELHPEMVTASGEFNYYEANFEIYEIPRRRIQKIMKSAHRRFFLSPFRARRLIQLIPDRTSLVSGAVRLAYRGFLGKG